MYGQRVLIVEDLPDWRNTLSGLLSDDGYIVRSAASREEALELLQAERFHVAVLDVRLDETDEHNTEGLTLMHQIRDLYPTVVVILLTGYATVQMVQEARRPGLDGSRPLAFDFLEKDESKRLPEMVGGAFQSEVRINPSLQIHGAEQFLPRLRKKLRFVKIPKPPPQQLIEEVDDLLRKLFFDCTEIRVQSIERGYSGVAVIRVDPVYSRGRGEVVIAKLGEQFLVGTEIDRYENLVRGLVGGHRIPSSLETANTRSLGGIVYTFAGLGTATDFATFYQTANKSEVKDAVAKLFEETCFPWQCEASSVEKGQDLAEVYMKLLRLNEQKLETRLAQTMGGRHPFHELGEGTQIGLGAGLSLLNPVRYVLSTDLIDDSFTSIIHGDLNGHNVLVDHHRDSWLIDFASTCHGPVLHDYATFETFLRLSLIKEGDWRLLYDWDDSLLGDTDFWDPELPEELASSSEIAKAHHAIAQVRQLIEQRYDRKAERRYLIGLLFNALKVLTIMDLPSRQRDHALISAALIAERLQASAR